MASRLNPHAVAFVPNPNAAEFVPNQMWNPSAIMSSTSTSSPIIGAPGTGSHNDLTDGVVATEAALLQVLGRLRLEKLLFVDCEGADLSKGSWRHGELQAGGPGFHGQLCLMQIGTQSQEVYAFDMLELGDRAFTLGLRALFENQDIIKVVHDFRQDADALWHQHKVRARSLFDTQLCDVLIRRLSGMATRYVMGSAKLLTKHNIEAQTIPGYGVLTQEQKQCIHERFSQDRHLWERRPLPEDMIIYAKADVLPMPNLYAILLQQLRSLVGDEASALRLALVGSEAYASHFLELETCRCRLCCRAEENAKFDGCRVFTRMAAYIDQRLLQRLLRPEDSQTLPEPGPSRFYINEHDESVPLPEQ